MAPQDEGVGGLAKRWLRTKVTELTTTDNRTRDTAGYQADETERQLRDAAAGEAVMAAVPGLRKLRDQQEAAALRRDLEEQEALRALPQAGLGMAVEGVATGSWSGLVRARIEHSLQEAYDDEGEPTGAVEDDLRVELIVLEDEGIPVVGGLPFLGWSFVVPGYQGPGRYDLVEVAERRDREGGYLDPIDFAVLLGSEDEGFYWTPEVGPASVEVDEGEASMTVRMSTSGAMGAASVVGRVNVALPPAPAR